MEVEKALKSKEFKNSLIIFLLEGMHSLAIDFYLKYLTEITLQGYIWENNVNYPSKLHTRHSIYNTEIVTILNEGCF